MSLPSADPRIPPFSLDEFSDLVCAAFNLGDADLNSRLVQPLLAFSPSAHSRSHPAFLDTSGDQRVPLLPSSSLDRSSRSRTITALQVFHHVRTRASAFLRSRAPSPTSPSLPPFQPLPTPALDLPTSPSWLASLSPWSSLDLVTDRPRSRADTLPRSLRTLIMRDTSPPLIPGHHSRPGSSSATRSPTPILRSFFDHSPVSKRAYSRPSTSSTVHPLSRMTSSESVHARLPMDALPSFFEDNGYQVAKPPAPLYSRPSTPSGSIPPIHARLPPLRKSKSNGHGILSRRRDAKSVEERRHVDLVHKDLLLWQNGQGIDISSSFTSPRHPPPVPDNAAHGLLLGLSEDAEIPPPPAYVFERRGSATSTSTSTGSTRSTSSLSSRLSNLVGLALSSKMRIRARSKLNLTVATGSEESSADSSPSTLSSVSISSPSTPCSPTSTFSRSMPHVYAASADGHAWNNSEDDEENVLAIGRVLTPEADPFAKAEIALPVHGTPRPPTPPLSRRSSSQQSPAGLNRTATWDHRVESKADNAKRIRNSLPASPVSTAYTFPSTCSFYTGTSPAPDYLFPASSMSTPKRQGPPSAWSPTTLSGYVASSPMSSPTRSPSHASRSGRQRSSPSSSDFPLPPTGLPVLHSPRVKTPTAPPVPPKDAVSSRNAYVHKSLPPTPRSFSGSPMSIRSRIKQHHWPDIEGPQPTSATRLARTLEDCLLDTQVYQNDVTVGSLAEPWAGTASRPATPVRSVVRRRSVDSTSTVTASPSSSALHEATRDPDSEASNDVPVSPAEDDDPFNSPCLSIQPLDESLGCWSPGASCTTLFYSAQSSMDSRSLASLETGEDGSRSLEGYSMNRWNLHDRRTGKAASAGPCT